LEILGVGLESLFQAQEFGSVGRQPEAQAAVVREQAQENAPMGHEVVKPLGILSDQPLEQCATTLGLEAVTGQQQRQALTGIFAALSLTALSGGIE
jgi:hypothetical protein